MSWASGTTVSTSEIWNYALTKSASYIIRVNGSYYEAINGATGKISYGGSGNNGGATGTSASSVIQAALDGLTAGRTWRETVLLRGNITDVTEIDIPSYTNFLCDGTLTASASLTQHLLRVIGTVGTPLTDIVIRCHCNVGNLGYYGIYLLSANNIVIADSTIQDNTVLGIMAENTRYCRFHHNYFYNTGAGIEIRNRTSYQNSINNIIDGNIAVNPTAASGIFSADRFQTGELRNITIANNTVYVTTAVDGQNGVGFENSVHDSVLANNVIYNGGRYGIIVYGTATYPLSNITVTGNTVKTVNGSDATSGIILRHVSNITVGNNTLMGTLPNGIEVIEGTTEASITGNTISQDALAATKDAIRLRQHSDAAPTISNVTITGNVAKNFGDGIYIAPTTSSAVTYTIVSGNNMTGCTTQYTDSGTDTLFASNFVKGNQGSLVAFEAHTADDTLTRSESGSVHTNLGAGVDIALTLPQNAVVGTAFEFVVMTDGKQLRVDAGAAGAIYINGAKSADDAYIWADDEGESVKLVADGNGDWVALYTQGTWTVV